MAKEIGCEFFPLYDIGPFLKVNCDVIILAVSIISFEEVLRILPRDMLRGKLVVDVLSVKVHAKKTMLSLLPDDCDILCTHPMFGPESGKYGWQGLPFLYDRVRLDNFERCVLAAAVAAAASASLVFASSCSFVFILLMLLMCFSTPPQSTPLIRTQTLTLTLTLTLKMRALSLPLGSRALQDD